MYFEGNGDDFLDGGDGQEFLLATMSNDTLIGIGNDFLNDDGNDILIAATRSTSPSAWRRHEHDH